MTDESKPLDSDTLTPHDSVPEPERKDVTAWLGLAPLVKQSGTSVNHKGRISFGNHILRKGLYMSVLGAMRNGNWEGWLEPHRARGKSACAHGGIDGQARAYLLGRVEKY